ncbi:hypothetical protein, partial [Escherichia phage ESSI2_ev129]
STQSRSSAASDVYKRQRLRFLDLEIFSVLFFYKPERQIAPLLAALRRTETEMIERNFIFFQ